MRQGVGDDIGEGDCGRGRGKEVWSQVGTCAWSTVPIPGHWHPKDWMLHASIVLLHRARTVIEQLNLHGPHSLCHCVQKWKAANQLRI